MSFRKYGGYKESGIEWLGEIPYGWDLIPLKYVSRINTHTLPEGTDPDYEFDYVDIGSVSDGSGITKTERMKYASAPSRARRLVQKGDVIISTVRTYLRAIAPITRDAENLVVSTGFCVVSPINELKSGYCLYLLQAPFFVETVVAQSVGVSYPATNASDIANIRIPIPNVEEQKQIVAFLDTETTNIDTLIDKQEQLITLLQEKRQVVISHAVTRGLNPNVKMKDSGIEWLGAVPEHWEVKKLKHILLRKKDSIKVGPFGSQLTTRDMEGVDIKVINQRNVIDNNFDFGDNFINHEKYIELRAFTIFPGDILITTRGTIGRTAIFPNNNGTSILHPCLMRLQVDEKYWLKELIALIIQGSGYFLEQLKFLSNATTIDVIYSENLKNVTIALPPTHEEQKRIIAFLDKETAKIDTLIEKCETAIELLKERRTALISVAVTGKIDVRNAV